MLKNNLLHPEILEALASGGHGTKILIADSNYPFATKAGPNARIVFLNLCPGKLNATDVLAVLKEQIAIESASVIMPESGQLPPIVQDFQKLIGNEPKIQALGRYEFYDAVKSDDCGLVIATGEQRTFACLLLTIGVVES
jgi:L-fucose mutarotase